MEERGGTGQIKVLCFHNLSLRLSVVFMAQGWKLKCWFESQNLSGGKPENLNLGNCGQWIDYGSFGRGRAREWILNFCLPDVWLSLELHILSIDSEELG